ncbi:SPFH domain-containing protein [Streptomyces sp. NPDC056529]|uniref:SPFH domain-containing protein n=1 Tax=Streptomyces sp. NPDC056529 TaxID=3345855 RepID=UPI0036B717C2
MTASTPNPADSGAAASRDAARTARRLTDGTLPRTSPPPTNPPRTPPVDRPAAAADAAAADAPVLQTAGAPTAPTPDAPAVPVTGAPAADAPAVPVTGIPAGLAVGTPAVPVAGAPKTEKAPETATPSASVAVAPVVPAAPVTTAPAPTVPAAGRSGGSVPGTKSDPASVSGTEPGKPGADAGAGTDPADRPSAPAAQVATAPEPPAPGAPGETGTTRPAADGASEAPATTAPGARAEKPTRTPSSGAPGAAPAKTPEPTPAKASTKGGTSPAAPTSAKASARGGTSPAAPTPTTSTTPPLPSRPTAATARPAPTTPQGDPPTPQPPAGATAPDFGRIKGARVAVVALPVAGVVRVARRKNVIGTETTGSIPVHLLFRDEPETAAAPRAKDDGGPDTLAMSAPVSPDKARAPGIPGPSKFLAPGRTDRAAEPPARTAAAKSRARHAAPLPSSRPAPTADPSLVERPGAVLPGWVGVVGGALALAWCAAVVWWTGAVPDEAARMLRLPVRPYYGVHLGQWVLLALGVVAVLFALGGLGRGRVGYAWVLTLFGDYRGTVRRTGLIWVSPLLLRRRVDVRLRHWRSEPLPAVDARGTALDVVVLVVWRVRDTVRASLGVDGHEEYLREQVEAAMARVLSQLPADAFHEDAPTLRDAEAVGEALTRMLSAECAPVGLDVFSAQPTRIEYAPEVATAMRRSRIAALDAKHRDTVLTSIVDAVDDVVHRLTSRGLVELDDYERKALVKDLTVAFYTGRTSSAEGA